MKKNRLTILNAPVDPLTMEETLAIINNAIQSKKILHHCDVNASKIVLMKKDPQLYKAIVDCDIISADGQSIVWASRILGTPLPERVTGIDLMENLVKLAYKNKYKIFFFGAAEDIVKKVVQKYSNIYSPEIIAGYRNGYFTPSEESNIARTIAAAKADILFVALPSPMKEIFLHKYATIINTTFTMGVGGSFDVVSGKIPRSPVWMQNIGMEWLYRLIQEPRKLWKRYLVTNTMFLWYLIKEYLQKHVMMNKLIFFLSVFTNIFHAD